MKKDVHSDRITQSLLDRTLAWLTDVVVVQSGAVEGAHELGGAEVVGGFAVHLVELCDAGVLEPFLAAGFLRIDGMSCRWQRRAARLRTAFFMRTQVLENMSTVS